MLRLRTRGTSAAGWLTILALIAMTSIIGCGGKEEASAPATGEEVRTAAAAALADDAALAATPAAEGEAAAEDSGLPEVDEAQKIQNFANLYGPITRIEERNWDNRVIEWVVFTPPDPTWVTAAHRGRRARLPLSMITDADAPEDLEGYFQIYPAASSSGRTVSRETVTASAESQTEAAAAETEAAEAPEAEATESAATETEETQVTAAAAEGPPEGASQPARRGSRGGGRGGRG